MAKELGTIISQQTGIELQDGPKAEDLAQPASLIESQPNLLAMQEQIAQTINTSDQGFAAVPINNETTMQFITALGSGSLLLLSSMKERNDDGTGKQFYATIHPDTDPLKNELTLIVLKGQGGWTPDHLDPQSDNLDQKRVLLELSAQARFGTTSNHCHGKGPQEMVVDPRHLTSTMGGVLDASRVSATINRLPTSEQHHFGDKLEHGDHGQRLFASTFSAQTIGEQGSELWNEAPVRTETYGPHAPAPYFALFRPELLADESFRMNTGHVERIVPVKTFAEGALQELQLRSFGRVIGQNGADDFQRRIESQLS